MGVLRTRKTWKRGGVGNHVHGVARAGHVDRLTPEQEENVRRALQVLRLRMGSLRAVSRAFGLNEKTVERVNRGVARATAGWAVKIAAEVGCCPGAVLSGAFPKMGKCPMCGREG